MKSKIPVILLVLFLVAAIVCNVILSFKYFNLKNTNTIVNESEVTNVNEKNDNSNSKDVVAVEEFKNIIFDPNKIIAAPNGYSFEKSFLKDSMLKCKIDGNKVTPYKNSADEYSAIEFDENIADALICTTHSGATEQFTVVTESGKVYVSTKDYFYSNTPEPVREDFIQIDGLTNIVKVIQVISTTQIEYQPGEFGPRTEAVVIALDKEGNGHIVSSIN